MTTIGYVIFILAFVLVIVGYCYFDKHGWNKQNNPLEEYEINDDIDYTTIDFEKTELEIEEKNVENE
jgi:hypothetical protein